ncbi:MAG: ATP-binding cassette domain-containing protein [Lachnospiraceae bacterium]|nr:ATP-binding cassette domain-containing protein [Lachnospiraceae bacterium]
MIEVNNLSHSFGDNDVLRDINLKIRDGEVLGLIGVNGAGKSTLLRLMSGILTPKSGQVLIDGIDVQRGEARRALFFLSDDPFFGIGTTADELYELYETFYPNINREIFEQLMSIAGLRRNSSLSKFSKGMRRQAFTALAFAVAPKYLLLDESFDGLDPVARERFKKQVRKTAENGSTIIISSHDLSELENFCDNYLVLSESHLIPPEDVADRIRNQYKFQIVFETAPDPAIFDILEPQQVRIVARVATVIAAGDKDDIAAKIEGLHPLLFDYLPMESGEGLLNTVTELAEGGEFV